MFIETQDGEYINSEHIVRVFTGYNSEATDWADQYKMVAVMDNGEKVPLCYDQVPDSLDHKARGLFVPEKLSGPTAYTDETGNIYF